MKAEEDRVLKHIASLTKAVPARQEKVNFLWIRRDFLLYGEFKQAREKIGMKVQKGCWWCRDSFSDNDMLALACAEKKGNKIICQSCADKAATTSPTP